jgi:hypothetical protein
MLFKSARAVYTFTAGLSSKNNKTTQSASRETPALSPRIKKGATGKLQLLLIFNGAETRIRTRDTRIFSPMLYRLSYLGAT